MATTCPTVGCGSEARGDSLAKHLAKPHVACSCGWAGIHFKTHVAGTKRWVAQGYRDPGEGVHEKINMEFDDDLGRWVRVSTPVSK